MEEIVVTKSNGKKIPCVAEKAEGNGPVAIMVHGMGASRFGENETFMRKALPAKGISVVTYDQPGQGDAEEDLRIDACLDSLACVEDYVAKCFSGQDIVYFGSSFGGYILGLYILSRPHCGTKAFFRSAALPFNQMLLGDPDAEPDPQVMEQFHTRGYLTLNLGTGAPVKLKSDFFEDLKQYDFFRMFAIAREQGKTGDMKMCFVHGEKDPLVPVQAIRQFAETNGYPLTVFPGEGHSINSSLLVQAKVASLAEAFYADELPSAGTTPTTPANR